MITKILISSLSILSLMNCQTQKKEADTEIKLDTKATGNTADRDPQSKSENDKTVKLKEGQSLFLKEQQMNVTFVGITEDSRCPEGVNCIWAGAATATIEVMSTTSRPRRMQISTTNLAAKNLNSTQSLGGYNFTLVDVTPYPKNNMSRDQLKGTYIISIEVEKGKPVENNKTSAVTK